MGKRLIVAEKPSVARDIARVLGASNRAEHLCSRLVIELVAVAEADPGLESALDKVINDGVEPFKVVNTLFGFCSVPARLESYPLNADLADLIVRLFGVENVTVKLFKANTASGIFDFKSAFCLDCTDLFKSLHINLPSAVKTAKILLC